MHYSLTPITFTGTVNGTNLVFTSNLTPDPGSSPIIWDGTLYRVNGVHYNVSGSTFTFTAGNAPTVGLTGFAGAGDVNFIKVSSITAMRAITSPEVNVMYYLSELGKQGFFRYDNTDTTSADNTGTVLVAGTARFKRVYFGDVNVQWFGVVADAVFGSSNVVTGTDQTAAMQLAVDFLINGSGGTLFMPTGNYLINGTVYIRPTQTNSVPFTIKGDTINNRTANGRGYGGTVIARNVTGDIFRVNLDSSGNTVLPMPYQYFSFGAESLSFQGRKVSAGDPVVTGIRAFNMFRTRSNIQNITAGYIDYGVYQAPTDANANENYCDQSIYKNHYYESSTLGGLYLYNADISSVENISFEHVIPQATFQKGIVLDHGDSIYVKNILTWTNTGVSVPAAVAGSALVYLDTTSNVTISGVHAEHTINMISVISISAAKTTMVNGLGTRFDSNNIFTLSNALGVTITGWSTDSTLVSGYYDINFVGSTNRNVTWTSTFFQTSPPTATLRSMSTAGLRGQYANPSDHVPVVAADANFTAVSGTIVRLPVITANRTITLPDASNTPGQQIVFWNQNTSGFTWTFVTGAGADLKNAAGVNITAFTNQTVTIAESYGTSNWLKLN